MRSRRSLVLGCLALLLSSVVADPTHAADDPPAASTEAPATPPSTSTLVVKLLDERGCPSVNARVLVDGRIERGSLDGPALPVATGVHDLALEVPRGAGDPVVLHQSVEVAATDRERVVTFSLATDGATCEKPAPSTTTAPRPAQPSLDRGPRSPTSLQGMTLAGSVLGGLGLLSLITSAGLGIAGFVQKGDLEDSCPCTREEIDDVRRTFVVGDLFLLTGVVSLAVAIPLVVVGVQRERDAAVAVSLRPTAYGVVIAVASTWQ
ncbi:MAG: hypothetical protein U0271_06205 [Polyangiaceae bacterium]